MDGRRALDWPLGRSPLIDDVERRHSWPVEAGLFLLSLVVGLLGGAACVMALALVAFIAVIVGMRGDATQLQGVLSAFQSGEPPQTALGQVVLVGMLAILNGALVLVTVVLASLIRRRRIWASFTSARRFRWRQLLMGLALYGLFYGVYIAVSAAGGQVELHWPMLQLAKTPPELVFFVLAIVALFIVAAGAEELLFRGWLLRESAAYTRNAWILAIVNGVLFAAIHVDPNTWALDPTAFVARAVLGCGFVYMALRLGGIEFSTGAHAANNILLTLAVEPLALKEPPAQPFQLASLLENAVYILICVGITELTVRNAALRRLAGVTAPTSPTAEVFR